MARKETSRFQFAVISGELKGRIITAPNLGITRPPLTRLRRAIFDFLNPYLREAAYLDLFSGTGAYLFEAVSRGARVAYGVERETRLAEVINRQAADLGVSDRLLCLCADVFEAIPSLADQQKRFDIIMIAPPQYKGIIDRTLATLSEHPVSSEEALILCQHDSIETARIDFCGLPILQQRVYGNTTFTVLGGG